jgi:DNA repair protein RadC
MAVLIDNLPPEQHPRYRLRAYGVDALTAREVLALILGRSRRRGVGTLDLADQLLHQFGGVRGLARAHPEDLARVPGVGAVVAASIVAAFQLCRLAARQPDDAVVIRGPEDIASLAWPRISGLRRESILLMVCDAGHRLRHVETVSMGGIDFAHLPVREILNCVVRHDGRAFAVAHNHPSGDSTPSDADVECSIALQGAADAVHLTFLGQVVVADAEWQAVETQLRPYWFRWQLTAASPTTGITWTATKVRRQVHPSRRARLPSSHGRPIRETT